MAIVERSLLFSWFLTSFSVQACRSITCDNKCFKTENSTSTLCCVIIVSPIRGRTWSRAQAKLAGKSQLGIMQMAFFLLAFWERKGVTTRERRRNKWRLRAAANPKNVGPAATLPLRTNKQKFRPRESLLADRSRRSHVLHLCAREMMDNRRWRCADPCSVMTGRPPVLKANAKGCRSVREHGRWHHVSDRCTCRSGASHGRGARSWKLFVSANVGAILSKANRAQGSPSEESKGKLLDNPSRREQFCGNALVARARLVKLTKKEKRGAFPQCQKRDFRLQRHIWLQKK